jgi:hypothetical protein
VARSKRFRARFLNRNSDPELAKPDLSYLVCMYICIRSTNVKHTSVTKRPILGQAPPMFRRPWDDEHTFTITTAPRGNPFNVFAYMIQSKPQGVIVIFGNFLKILAKNWLFSCYIFLQ